MKLTSIMTRCNYTLPISIDIDKCYKIGTYSKSYPKAIGRRPHPMNDFVTVTDTITVYRTYGKLLGTELEYIIYNEQADGKSIAYPATGDDLVEVNYEFLGNWKDNKLLSC